MRSQLKPLLSQLKPATVAPKCQPCLRQFATTAIARAGHNKWSKTKHIKAVTDKKKMDERNSFTKAIEVYSRSSIPKSLIEGAIARGQGRSATGAKLEPMTIEALIPPNIAILVEAETDNKARSIPNLKLVVKEGGALHSASAFYFTRRGRAIFKSKSQKPDLSELMEEAIEHEGLEDIEEMSNGNILAWVEPAMLMSVTQTFSKKLDLDIVESELIFAPNEETIVTVDSTETAEILDNLFTKFKEYPEVKGIYANVRRGDLAEGDWGRVERHLDI
ncbi:transcriptional regulatory protein-like protein [Emericellopsis cladophorae]|uniref:Transcriptional regulatory protein-like protein n=1 Tax=Emericellopsis cladophorae TaxID=2686198 RepID=A0A9P9Y946_9HYPO|nr:transcriptional regulatory protein-like protein [Emericellopsis cladophorae]KAI6785731.1 transcriptional regulatory protein-like protein [Emericellopsis cladophorae]